MKVLSIISSGYEQGGAETAMKIYVDALKSQGHETIVVSSNARPELQHFSDYEFNTVPQHGVKSIFYALFNPSAYSVAKQVLRDHKPDVVILNTMQQVTPSVLFLLKKYPTIQIVHGPEAFTTDLLAWHMQPSSFKHDDYDLNDLTLIGKAKLLYLKAVLGPLYKIGFRNVDRFVVFSTFMQEMLREDGIKKPIVRVRCGFDLPKQYSSKRPVKPVIGYAGRLESYKGVDDLLEAMPTVLQKHTDAQLVLAGDGSRADVLRRRADKLGIAKSVVFKGHVNQAELYDLYRKMTVFVMPSRWPEAFGKVGIEAMSVGTPVVATNVGGVKDWLEDGKNGLLVKPNEPRNLAEAIEKILNNKELRGELAGNAEHSARRFSKGAYGDDMLSAIKDVVN